MKKQSPPDKHNKSVKIRKLDYKSKSIIQAKKSINISSDSQFVDNASSNSTSE